MISTIVIILIVVLLIILGAHRGAARSLLNFAAMIACSVAAHFLSGALAQAVYDGFIKASVIRELESTVAAQGAEFAAKNSLQALPDALEGFFGFLLRLLGVTPGDLQGRLVFGSAQTESIARTIEKPLGELVVFLLSAVFAGVLFLVLWLLCRLLVRQAARVFELPVIRTVNRIFGGIIGALEGLVLTGFLANLLYVLLSCTNPAALDSRALFGGLFRALLIFN